MINKINFSTTINPPKTLCNTEKKDNIFQKNMVEFPKYYGYTNVAFCGKHRKGNNKQTVRLTEFLRMSKDKDNHPMVVLPDLPVLTKYANSVMAALKCLSSTGSCMVAHNPEIDSKQIFLTNLRSFIDTNMVKRIGFDRETPFLYLNLADYADDTKKAFQEITKDVNKQIKGTKKPILFVEGVKAFFDRVDRPHEFAQNSIFKKYPTLFFMEEGFNVLKDEDSRIYRIGFTPKDKRDKNEPFDEEKFLHLVSKMNFINKSRYIVLASVSDGELVEYLDNPLVQKHLITDGNDIKFEEGCIEFSIQLAKSMSYFQENYYNSRHKERLLDRGTSPINLTVDILKRALMLKLIRAPKADSVTLSDVMSSLPYDSNWIQQLQDFSERQSLSDKIAEIKAKSEDAEQAKTAPASENKTDKKVEKQADNTEENASTFEVVTNPKTRFSDVGGMYNIKKQLKEEFIDILKNKKVKNSQKPSGILLSGPPGCGKTLLARAIAGEAGVPFVSTAGSSFIEMYVGVGPKRVRELYAKAKEEAKNHPSKTAIVFIDEVDAVAGSRKNNGGSEDLRTINALLHEMDGANNKDEQDVKVITIVATNYEGMIDEAFKRSGRIDLKYTIDDPRHSVKAREEILKIHSKELTFKDKKDKQKLIHALAQTTSGLSGADLAELLKKANRMSLRVNRTNNYVTQEDLQEAKMQVMAGVKTDMEHTHFELKQTIAHEAGHAINSLLLEKIFENEPNKHKMPSRVLDFITNSARGNSLGATYFKPSEENKMGSKETNLADLITLYGGYAIEAMMFDTHSAGVSSDLKVATEIIENSVSKYDFGSEKHFISLDSELTKNLFRDEIKQDIINFAQKGMSIAKEMITFAKLFIEEYVTELLSDKNNLERTISSKEFKGKFAAWLKKNKKTKECQKLCEDIKSQIDDFCKEKGLDKAVIGFAKPQ